MSDNKPSTYAKFTGFVDLFRKGSEVVNVAAWKKGQITGTLVGGFIIAAVNIASMFGHPLPVDSDAANAIGGGIVAFANVLLTAATSKRAGILPAKSIDTDRKSDTAEPAAMPTVEQADATEYGNAVQPEPATTNKDVLSGLDTTYTGG